MRTEQEIRIKMGTIMQDVDRAREQLAELSCTEYKQAAFLADTVRLGACSILQLAWVLGDATTQPATETANDKADPA